MLNHPLDKNHPPPPFVPSNASFSFQDSIFVTPPDRANQGRVFPNTAPRYVPRGALTSPSYGYRDPYPVQPIRQNYMDSVPHQRYHPYYNPLPKFSDPYGNMMERQSLPSIQSLKMEFPPFFQSQVVLPPMMEQPPTFTKNMSNMPGMYYLPQQPPPLQMNPIRYAPMAPMARYAPDMAGPAHVPAAAVLNTALTHSVDPQSIHEVLKKDLYTPMYVRDQGKNKEGKCRHCVEDQWFKLKNGSYWHHLQIVHGISPKTRTYFSAPVEFVTNPTTKERKAFCGVCEKWISVSGKRSQEQSVWYRHASRCHDQISRE